YSFGEIFFRISTLPFGYRTKESKRTKRIKFSTCQALPDGYLGKSSCFLLLNKWIKIKKTTSNQLRDIKSLFAKRSVLLRLRYFPFFNCPYRQLQGPCTADRGKNGNQQWCKQQTKQAEPKQPKAYASF